MSNDFLVWDATGTNITNQADYAASSYRTGGAVSGIAPSAIFNKSTRQATVMAAVIADLIIASLGGGTNVVDDGTTAAILAQLIASIQAIAGGQPPGGGAGGDLTGSYPNPTIKGSVVLTGSPTTSLQALGDASAKIATTGFVNRGGAYGVPGYRLEPDGTIVQWTFIAVGPTGSSWTFPLVFPNQIFNISAVTVGTPTFVDAPLIPTFTVAGLDVDYFNTVTGNVFIRVEGN